MTATVALGAAIALPSVLDVVTHGPDAHSFDGALVDLCSLVLLLALGWAWVVTTGTVAQLVSGRTASARGGLVRSLVLIACGVVVVGAGSQAHAEGGAGGGLHGLPYPDRAAAALPASPGPAATKVAPASVPTGVPTNVVVRRGDSLWSIAARTAGPGESVDARWRGLLAANRALLGDDPDLILPGQRIVIPRPRAAR